MKNFTVTIIALPILCLQSFAQVIEMRGVIADLHTKLPVEFANIGIFDKNIGTISNQKGAFNLKASREFHNDVLTITHINYHPLRIDMEPVLGDTIFLEPRTNELSEVNISNRKKKTRKLGVKSFNPLLWLGGISTDHDIIENAQKINIPDKTVRIKYVNIYLRKGFESDSSYVRINFYKNQDNSPGNKIVFENTLQKKKIEPGWLQIDLRENFIYLEEDFFIGVEFIPDFTNPLEVYLGAILTKGKGYSRRSSQGKWNKLQGASTINVVVEY